MTIDNLLNLKENTRKSFKRHFLNAVHCEIGFSGTFIESILASESSLKSIFKTYGFETTRKLFQKEVRIENKNENETNEPMITHEENVLGLVFSSQKPRRELHILNNKIIYSDFSYKGFDPFLKSFHAFCENLKTVFSNNSILKVGLRKIDSIMIDPVTSYEDACSIFNPALFGHLRSGLLKDNTLKVHEEVTVLEKDEQNCIIRSQMRRGHKNSAYEAILDFDLVDLSQTTLERVFNKTLPELNKWHFDLFIWAASEELLNLMTTEA